MCFFTVYPSVIISMKILKANANRILLATRGLEWSGVRSGGGGMQTGVPRDPPPHTANSKTDVTLTLTTSSFDQQEVSVSNSDRCT